MTDAIERTEPSLRAARRQLVLDAAGIAAGATGFGFVYGLAAREAGLSVLEAQAMSVFAFAGAAQFAAVGYISAGVPWAAIAVLTFFLNARHLLYSAALAPMLRHRPLPERAVAAHLLTDEAFALAATHFRRVGRTDMWGYWLGAIGATLIPWNLATFAGATIGGSIPDPTAFGLDIVFPAAMLGLSVGLITGRRELVAAGAGGGLGLVLSLLLGPEIGVVGGGLVGPLAGIAMPTAEPASERHPDGPLPFAELDIEQAFRDLGQDPSGDQGPGEPGGTRR